MDIRDKVAQSPMTAFQVRAVVLCVLLNMIDGFDVLVMPFTAKPVGEEFEIGDVFIGYLLSASLIGMAIGSILLTPLSDRVGRRRMTLLAVGLSSLGMAAAVVVPTPEALLVTRVVAGIGIGAMISNLAVIVSEYTNARRKALAMGIFTAGYPIGAAGGGFVAAWIIDQWGWRTAFGVGAALTMGLLVASIAWMPESYDYLVSRGDPRSLDRLNGILASMGQEGMSRMPQVAEVTSGSTAVREVFGPQKRAQTLLMWVGYAMLTMSFYFANSWLPKTISDLSGDNTLGPLAGTMFNVGGAVGSVVFGIFALRILARRVLVGAMVAAAALYALLAVTITSTGLAMGVGVFAGLAVTAGVAGVYMLGPALYSTTVRAAGFGWLIGVGRLMAIFAPIIGGYLFDAGATPTVAFLVFAVPFVVAAIAFTVLGRVGRSVDETVAAVPARAS